MARMNPRQLSELFDKLVSTNSAERFLAENDPENFSNFLLPLLSYWQKWMNESSRRALDEMALKYRPVALDQRFSNKDLAIIIFETYAIQLSIGCSGACPKCMFDAVHGVREHFEPGYIKNLISRYKDFFERSTPIFYHASDPKDYPDYADLHRFIIDTCNYDPHVTTKISDDPKSLEWAENLLSVSENVRFSLYHMLDEKQVGDLAKKLKKIPKLSKTPCYEIAGNHDVRLSLMSVLDNWRKEDLSMTHSRENFDIFSPNSDAAMESASKDVGHIGGRGITYESPQEIRGLARNGVFITPRGAYNSVRLTATSAQFPQGLIVIPIVDIGELTPCVGDFLPDLLPHCVVRRQYFDGVYGDVEDDSIGNFAKAMIRDYMELSAVLTFGSETEGISRFKIKYDNEGYITFVQKTIGQGGISR
ncbi:MAG: hypothetical protein PHP74_03270 [Candidatus Gracilibacteria bacterium]|nr:hypothetical protein [Candidatus Gracilibacteria bacterium]